MATAHASESLPVYQWRSPSLASLGAYVPCADFN